jgi:hypothetical protein
VGSGKWYETFLIFTFFSGTGSMQAVDLFQRVGGGTRRKIKEGEKKEKKRHSKKEDATREVSNTQERVDHFYNITKRRINKKIKE